MTPNTEKKMINPLANIRLLSKKKTSQTFSLIKWNFFAPFRVRERKTSFTLQMILHKGWETL